MVSSSGFSARTAASPAGTSRRITVPSLLRWISDGSGFSGVAGWALGVWGAVAGSLLLLLRSRFAVWAFALSLAGVVIMTAYTMANPYPAAMTSTGATVFEWTIKLVALLLLVYAWAMRKRGVLR